MTKIKITIRRAGPPNPGSLIGPLTDFNDQKKVSVLKQTIKSFFTILPKDQSLFYYYVNASGVKVRAKLQDHKTLSESGITDGSEIELQDPAVIQIFSIDSLPGSTKKPCWVYLTDTILTIKTKIHPADPDKYTVSLDGTTLVNTAIVTGTLREGNVIDLIYNGTGG